MEPPPPPSSSPPPTQTPLPSQFRVPEGPARPRTAPVGSTTDSIAPTTSTASPLVSTTEAIAGPSSTPLSAAAPATVESTSTTTETTTTITTTTLAVSTALSQSSQDPNEGGVVFYKKPIFSASQIAPTQPTQIVEGFCDLDLEDEKVPCVCLHGYGTTMHAELSTEKPVHVFGTSPECDVIISHVHWGMILEGKPVDKEPWFKIYLNFSNGQITASIEDVSSMGVLLNGNLLPKSQHKRKLGWGDFIRAGMEGRELFKYSFKGITNQESNNPETVVEGDISTYTLGDEIGGGTYAKVYRAVERNSNAIYACKAIDRSREMNKQEKDSIPFEIELLRTQSHKHIVKFKDSCHWGSMTYIFTEYINGVTLHVYCQHQNNYLTETEARHIFRQTCEAINYLHARSIVHRDIKSENIMITREDDVVKLIDFGLARDSSSREVLNTHCGTRPYMAPEAALSDESNGYGKWVDIWALGVLLFRMLTGIYPFDEENYESADLKHLNDTKEAKQEIKTLSGQKRRDSEINYSAGLRQRYQLDWRSHVDKLSPRSPEVKQLLEKLLCIDPTRRIRADQIFWEDWIKLSKAGLAKYDVVSRQGSTAILRGELSADDDSSSTTTAVDGIPWGKLEKIPGSIADAPRCIELTRSKTWLGRNSISGSKSTVIHLVNDRFLSTKHCLIHRGKDGIVMVSDTGFNRAHINNLPIDSKRACQLLDGDELGLIVPEDRPELCDGEPVRRFLKYKVTIFQKTDEDGDPTRRRYRDHDIKLRHARERSPRPQTGEPWGVITPFGKAFEGSRKLTELVTVIGRDAECDVVCNHSIVSRKQAIIEWDAEEQKAYLRNCSQNGTKVNGATLEGRLQLRSGDKITLANYVRPQNPEDYTRGFEIELLPIETMPRIKRSKENP